MLGMLTGMLIECANPHALLMWRSLLDSESSTEVLKCLIKSGRMIISSAFICLIDSKKSRQKTLHGRVFRVFCGKIIEFFVT